MCFNILVLSLFLGLCAVLSYNGLCYIISLAAMVYYLWIGRYTIAAVESCNAYMLLW